jgi:nucleoid-associated protein YgaU
MDKLVAGFVLIGLAVMVLLAVALHYSLGPALEPPPVRTLDPDRPSSDDGGGTVIVTLGAGRDLGPSPETAKPWDEWLKELDGELTAEERNQLDDRGYLPYTVKKDETLSKIAQHYLGSHRLWTVIHEHNPDLRTPEELREGMTIRIPVWLKQR